MTLLHLKLGSDEKPFIPHTNIFVPKSMNTSFLDEPVISAEFLYRIQRSFERTGFDETEQQEIEMFEYNWSRAVALYKSLTNI